MPMTLDEFWEEMTRMRQDILSLGLAMSFGLFVSSCSNDDVVTPTLTLETVVEPKTTAPDIETQADLADAHGEVCSIHISHDCGIEQQMQVSLPKLTEIQLPVTCDLTVRVNEDGGAEPVRVDCTDARFEQTVRDAASTIRYETHDACGNVCRTIGREYEYPVVFAEE